MHSKHAPFDKPGKPLTGVLLFIIALVIGAEFISTVNWVNFFASGIFILWGIAEFTPQTVLRSYMRAIALLCFYVWAIGVACIWGYQLLRYLIIRWF